MFTFIKQEFYLMSLPSNVIPQSNIFSIADIEFSSLNCIPDDYDTPEYVPEIQWIIENASFVCKHNGESGVFDFIFNLNMLDTYVIENPPSNALVQELESFKDSGIAYLLFNQGC